MIGINLVMRSWVSDSIVRVLWMWRRTNLFGNVICVIGNASLIQCKYGSMKVRWEEDVYEGRKC